MTTGTMFLQSAVGQLAYYKKVAERSFEQLSDEQFFWQYNEESNSIAIIIKHMYGNMLSRWTDFLTTDGEKPDRMRDAEFENEQLSREKLMEIWEAGWQVCFNAINNLSEEDLHRTIYIRAQPQSALDAINRQLAHYPYHIGQIVYVAKMLRNEAWTNLTIPRKKS